jgi:hypothetical protein
VGVEPPHRVPFFFARSSIAAGSPVPTGAGLQTLRRGSGVVVTPMTLDASKEDVGKGGASPAPLPKILEAYRGEPCSGLQWGFVRGAVAIGQRLGKSC